jgi:hypothetical protein
MTAYPSKSTTWFSHVCCCNRLIFCLVWSSRRELQRIPYNRPLGLSSGVFFFASRGVFEFGPMWPKNSVFHTISAWGYLLEASFCSCCGLLEFRPTWPKCSVYHTIGFRGYLLEPSFSHLAMFWGFGRYGIQSASGVSFCSCLFHILWLTGISARAAQVQRIPCNRPLGLSSGAFSFAYLTSRPCGPSTTYTIQSASGAIFWRLLF